MDGRKAGGMLVWLVLAGVSGSCASTSRPARTPESPPPVATPSESGQGGSGQGGSGQGGSGRGDASSQQMGLSQRERESFYHLPQGNEHLWLPVLQALPSRAQLDGRTAGFSSFLDGPERFGFLPDPDHPEGLPIGIALVPASEREPVARVGTNCAACHVGEFRYGGKRLLVNGAPGLLSLEDFNREAVEVMSRTLTDRTQLLGFLDRLAGQLSPRARDGGLQAAYPDTDLTPDGYSSAHEKLVAEVEWYCSQDPGACAPPKLGPEPERGVAFDRELVQYTHELSRKQVRTVPDAIRVLRGHLVYFMRLGRLKFGTYSGPGRVDAFGVARGVLFGPEAAGVLAAPVSVPCLWEFQTAPWLHWDGNTNSMMERNIGQSLGMGATVDRRTFESSILPRNLAELERLSRKIATPRWPEQVFGTLDAARIERGREVFDRNCQECHGNTGPSVVPLAQVGTDGNRARSFAAKVGDLEFPSALQDLLARVKQRAYARDGLSQQEVRPLDPGVIYWRAPVGYVARPLAGIWATSPYLHNGSVPTLWDLLQPVSERPTRFPVGQYDFDPGKVGYATEVSGTPRFTFDVSMPGNGNAGHEYGTDLSDEEKRDLIEYLKSL